MPHSIQGALRLYYRDRGRGRPVLLVHGGYGRGDFDWGALRPMLRGSRTIVPDIRGHGRSTNPDRSLERRAAAADLARLLDELNLQRVRVGAFSLGTHLALWLMQDRPDLVERAVLVGPTMNLDPVTRRRFASAQPQVAEARGEGWATTLRMLHPPGRWRALMEDLKDGQPGHPEWTPGQLGRIRARVLVIAGDRDYFGAPSQQPRRVAAAIPGARYLELPGPHAVHRDGPSVSTAQRLIADFLTEPDPADPAGVAAS